MRRFLLPAFVFVSAASLLFGLALAEGTLIAFYTLDQTAADQTGNYADAEIINAPYEDGGVYLNGNYVGSDPDSSSVRTPNVTALDFAALSVYLEFKVSDLPSGGRPILFCGSSWRWMGASMNYNGQVYLSYNGLNGPYSSQTVSMDTWHTLAMIHDGTTGHLILDGVEVGVQDFVPNHHDDRRFVMHNGGNGLAFKGHVRNLRIYNGIEETLATEPSTWGDVKSLYR